MAGRFHGARRSLLAAPALVAAAPAAMSFITDSAAKKYLTTTWSHAPTDPTRATISYWVKYGVAPHGDQYMFTTAASSGVLFDHAYVASSFKHRVQDDVGVVYNAAQFLIAPDNGVWHHVCVVIDTNLATAADRVKFFVDGNQGTDAPAAAPAQFSNMQVTANGIASYIGEVSYQVGGSTGIPDAKFTYFYLIDGQALTPSSFTSGTPGVGNIHPAAYGGTFGANGVFLNGNGSSLTDQSGAGNNFTTPNGISFSADIPT